MGETEPLPLREKSGQARRLHRVRRPIDRQVPDFFKKIWIRLISSLNTGANARRGMGRSQYSRLNSAPASCSNARPTQRAGKKMPRRSGEIVGADPVGETGLTAQGEKRADLATCIRSDRGVGLKFHQLRNFLKKFSCINWQRENTCQYNGL